MTTSNKFKEASDALYQGDGETAAELLAAGVAEVARANTPAVDTDALANAVRQKLAAAPAIEALFARHPEIKEKKAFAAVADDYAADFMAKGDDVATAIRKAGDAVAKEYGLGNHSQAGKHSQASRQAGQSSRQSEASDEGEEDYPEVIAELRASRPGNR
jgi:hypothetical protein